MSYSYNDLVASIASHRRKAMQEDSDNAATHLQNAVDTFATLSSHCPMTPLLWMQYAQDTSRLLELLLSDKEDQAADMRLQTIELGLAEFPGCALLRLHYLQLLVEKHANNNNNSSDKVENAFQEAIAAVARGSHRNEGHLVAAIYRLYTEYLVSQQKPVIHVFVQRARTPLKDANDGLVAELQDFCNTHNLTLTSDDLQKIEQARRYAARTFDSLVLYEDDVDVAMHAEGILTRHEYSHDDMDWEQLLKSEGGRLWMGFGGTQTANAIVKYAQACSYYKVPKHEADEQEAKEKQELLHSLALAIYERGVAECPTVESLWLSYLRQLMYLISIQSPLACVSRLESVASRAARNCPYSVQLLQQQIKTSLVLAQAGHAVFDPDALTTIVDNAIKSKFLPNAASQLELYMAVIQTIKRRILSILVQEGVKYDGTVEQNGKQKKDEPVVEELELGEAAEQEVQDLVEDIRDVYDAADTFLRKHHNSWSEGRTVLWKDRALTETYLLGPLLISLEGSGESTAAGEGLRCFDKLVKVHQPPHPDSYAIYIREFIHQPAATPRRVLRNIQTARSLFQKALKTVGKPKETQEPSSVAQRDRMTALQCLCQDYLEFEQMFGSDDSYVQASKEVKKKFESIVPNGNQNEERGDVASVVTQQGNGTTADVGSKRSRKEEDASDEPATKKQKASASLEDVEMKDVAIPAESSKETPANTVAEKTAKHPVHKVRVGKMDYPAHPFTVQVANLATETEDMDLVDLFRPKCGSIVHAKIVREKSHKPGKHKSKGWGLVQFEERESVEKALELNDVIGIHEHVVKVDRSHVPAVGLVPPGMHRVKPRGEGKSSKRNQKMRVRKMSHDEAVHEKNDGTSDSAAAVKEGKPKAEAKAKASSNARILAFRPRAVKGSVAHGSAHRKVKLSLGKEDSKG